MNHSVHKKIYTTVLEALKDNSLTHNALISEVTNRLYGQVANNDGRIGEFTEIRGIIGTVVNEMRSDGVIFHDNGNYTSGGSVPFVLQLESCEKLILDLLKTAPKTKQQIRSFLQKQYKTDTTKSDTDDRMLFDYMGQILRRMINEKKIVLKDGRYCMCEQTRAVSDDLSAMLELKSSFVSKIHRNGGEFFEHYIMTLLEKHQIKYGKKVTECRTTGGTSDGGIDGIIKTQDPLGFKETIMIQAKNRTDLTTETTVRGFYGALCASGGSRGIFATMSDFHPGAKLFLSGIDNCVGINGDDIFRIACECLYGIKKSGGKLMLDNKIL